ncbi:MAG: DUF2341 domain-containing protein [Candidatus Aminicenantes bacterium]|nr:DUF2341 domain-containing protein [Candidatus Aminicenantes bacterium]
MIGRKIELCFLGLLIVLFFSGLAFGAYTVKVDGVDKNFSYRRQITIQASKVQGGPHSYFPMLFDSTTTAGLPTDLQWAGDGPPGKVEQILGWDIVFAMGQDQEILKHEVEKYSASSGEYIAWVKIDSLTTTTQFYLYYGSTDVSTDTQHVSAVWDSVYAAVWHLHNDFLDSTSNNNDGSNFQSADIGGQIADGQNFDGSNDYIDVGTGGTIANIFGSTGGTGGTISAWIYPTTWGEGSFGRILDKATDTLGYDGWTFLVNNVGWPEKLAFARYFNTTPGERGFWYTPSNSMSLDAWQHVVVTYDETSTSNWPIIYIDSAIPSLSYDDWPVGTAMDDSTVNCRIGNFAGGSTRTFEGVIDEVRMSDSIRSGDWIKTEYSNQWEPQNFYQVSAETLVELSYFRATSFDSAVILEWATETELDNAGFNIWRSEDRDRDYVRINLYFIPGEGEAGFGAEYSLTDYDVTNGVVYYYKLEEIDLYGKSLFHGPVPAIPHDIIPIWPDEGKILSSEALLFSWASLGNYSYKVEISLHPSFPASETLSFPREGWTTTNSLWLVPREWEMLLRKAQQSEGWIFWRVRARSEVVREICSEWQRFVIDF